MTHTNKAFCNHCFDFIQIANRNVTFVKLSVKDSILDISLNDSFDFFK